MLAKGTALASTKWLNTALRNGFPKDLRVVDATWHLPSTKRDGRKEYEENHIPGAAYFDIDECCDKATSYSHMLPEVKQFERYAGDLGIGTGTHVIVYDNSENAGFFSAPRVWWMFRVFGHASVSVLDGGFKKWCSEGLPTNSELPSHPKTVFYGLYQPHMEIKYEDVVDNLKENSFDLIDARTEGRFKGTMPEPREGIESGHIPGAKNLFFKHIVDHSKGELLDKESLNKMFEDSGIDLSKPVVSTCGSGVSACNLTLAAYICGKEVPVYDGSWTEWYLRSTPEMRVKDDTS